ncbi:MAG: sigma-70 family RNA polymerase sigma factor [Chloroflexi bacterium]|nr:sigma-70 family RNA polymerase sigma factor [Chloroflexota bacterium]
MIEQVFREQWSRVLASLIRALGDFELAEEAAQEAFTMAAERWPRTGVPANPVAWLVATGRNKAIDRLRRQRTLAAKTASLELPTTVEDEPDLEFEEVMIQDERLELIFMCCHPALATEAQVALTLRAVGGLTNDEIARAFLVTPETMKRRLSRAKAKIGAAGIPFEIPSEEHLQQRLAAVLAIVYLIFNEGYAGRVDLAAEAIRLCQLLVDLMPTQPEAHGLLALMLCHDARRKARFRNDELVLLEDQDRSMWDMAQIEHGRAVLDRAMALGGRGPYVLQAAIASLQIEPVVDWRQVATLYGELVELTHSPVVELNRSVAVAQAGWPAEALEIVDALSLDEYPYLHSTRAELLRRLGRTDEARAEYHRALALTAAEPERRFLERRLAEL